MAKKKRIYNFIPWILVTGLALSAAYLLFPVLEDGINSANTVVKLNGYAAAESNAKKEELDKARSEAQKYNDEIFKKQKNMDADETVLAAYDKVLNLNHDGIMATIEIPSLNIFLPIGHGTSDALMQQAVGNMEFTSVPYGGVDTHSVLSSHTGLESARLFSDIDKLKKGDRFYIHVLGETHTYECDRILTVKPEDADPYLTIIPGSDLVTLYTCTPYGVNTHRLLVTGKRVKTKENTKQFATAIQGAKKTAVLECVIGTGIPVTIWVLGACIMCKKRRKGNAASKEKTEEKSGQSKQ